MKKLLAILAFLVVLTAPADAQNLGVSGSYYLQTTAAPTQTCSETSYNGIFAISKALTLYQCSNNNTAGTFSWNVIGGGASTALPNGTTAVTQAPGDTSTDVATDSFVATAIANAGSGTGTGTGTAASTNWYVSPTSGTTSSAIGSANSLRGFGFVPATNVTFGSILVIAHSPDASNLYSVAITNSSGQLICHPTAGQAIPALNTIMTNTCSEGSVTLTAGQVYVLVWGGSATNGTLQGFSGAGSLIYPFESNAVSGCTTASGVISGTCNITLSPVMSAIGIPDFTLH